MSAHSATIIAISLQLYKKTPASIASLDSSQVSIPDLGALVTTLLDQQSAIGAHNRIGLSSVIADKDPSYSNW